MATDETQAERRLRGVREFIGLLSHSQDEMDAIDIGREAIRLLRQLPEWDRDCECVFQFMGHNCNANQWEQPVHSPLCERHKIAALLARATGEEQ